MREITSSTFFSMHAVLHLQAATRDAQNFINQLVEHIEALMKQLENLGELSELLPLLTDFDMTEINKYLPKIRELLGSGNNLDVIVDK